jgi:chromosomal replication initiation ATPase DnaA
VFRLFPDAQVFEAADLPTDLPRTAVVVQTVAQLPSAAEETLFHLHNHLRAARLPLLLTSTKPPIQWDIALPDLASRMQAAPTAQIDDPDDRLLMAVLMKHFSDRQLTPKPQLISYIANHIERSFSAAADIVAKLDAHALRTGEKINTTLAKQYLPFHGH